MLHFCPGATVARDGCIPARVVPITADGSRNGRGHLEEVETLGDVLTRLGVTDCTLDPNRIVIKIKRVQNVHCGGTALWWIGLANHDVGRLVGSFTSGVYLSEQGDGKLCVTIPA